MQIVAASLMAVPVALALYCWFGYPVLLLMLGRGYRPRSVAGGSTQFPTLTVVITAHNAGPTLRQTLNAVLASDYPEERRSILVVSDGSGDDTVDVARSFRHHGVRIRHHRRQRGKTAAENIARPLVVGDIVVFMDANVVVSPGALRALVDELRDPSVGVVSGTDVLIEGSGAFAIGERAYVNYEMWIRRQESRWSGVVGASGCLYAIRRSLYVPLRKSMTRDFASVLLAARKGQRAVLAPAARCRIAPAVSARVEYRRRIRTIVQGLETLGAFRDLLNPIHHGRFAIALLSHKLGRWLLPLLVPVALCGAVIAAAPYAPRLATPLLAAIASLVLVKARPVMLAGYACLVHAAALVAWYRFLSGHRIAVWEPTRRSPHLLSTPR